MDAFPKEVHDKLGWYVYRLIDPRSGNTFYVGKGRGDRVFQHARGELIEEDADPTEAELVPLKRAVIQDIQRSGLAVLHLIHRHGIEDEQAAYEIEAALMDAYPGLTNLAGGHRSSLVGCRSVEQIVAAYKADPLVVKEPLILIFIGRTLDQGRDIYDSVRGVWTMNRARAEQHKLVLAYDGVVVVGAYRPRVWKSASPENFDFIAKDWSSPHPRIGFEGEPAQDVWADYVGKRVPPRRKGAALPFRYLKPGTNRSDPDSLIEADD